MIKRIFFLIGCLFHPLWAQEKQIWMPPSSMDAWYGQVLVASLQGEFSHEAKVLWKKNDKILCEKRECLIPLQPPFFQNEEQTQIEVSLLDGNFFWEEIFSLHIKPSSWKPSEKKRSFLKPPLRSVVVAPQNLKKEEIKAQIDIKNEDYISNEENTKIESSIADFILAPYSHMKISGEGKDKKVELEKGKLRISFKEGKLKFPLLGGFLSWEKTSETILIKEDGFKAFSLSGMLKIHLQTDQGEKILELPPMLLFHIKEDGMVQEFQKILKEELDRILLELKKEEKTVESPFENLAFKEVEEKFQGWVQNEDYFSIIQNKDFLPEEMKMSSDILYLVGKSYAGTYQKEEALSYFQKALSFHPHHEKTLLSLAQLYMEEKKWEEALLVLEKMPPVQRNSSTWNYYQGVCLFQKEQYFKSKIYFQKVLWINEDIAEVNSAQRFMGEIQKNWPWQFSIPLGVQWGNNEIDVKAQEEVPMEYGQKWLVRLLSGVQGAYRAEKYGFDLGYMHMRNEPHVFRLMDGNSFSAGAYTLLGEYRINTGGSFYISQKNEKSYGTQVGIQYQSYQTGLQWGFSKASTSFTWNHQYFYSYQKLSLPFSFSLQNTFEEQKKDQWKGTLGVSPTYPFSFSRWNLALMFPFNFQKHFYVLEPSIDENLVLDTGPVFNVGYGVASWLQTSFSAFWNMKYVIRGVEGDIYKIGASIMVIGIF